MCNDYVVSVTAFLIGLYCLHGIANTQPSLSMSSFCLVIIFLFAFMIRRFLLCVRYPTFKNLGAIVQQRESIFEHRILRGRLLLLLQGLIPMHASDATHAHLCGSSTVVTNAMQCNEVHKHILPVDSSSCVPAPPSCLQALVFVASRRQLRGDEK